MNNLPDIIAFAGLAAIAAGVQMIFGTGWALVAFGSGLYLTAITTVFMNAFITNREE